MVLSGITSVIALVLLYAGDTLASAVSAGHLRAAFTGGGTIAALIVLALVARSRHRRSVGNGNPVWRSSTGSPTSHACSPRYAVAVPVGIPAAAAAYLAVQLIRQIPATPGGLGLVEASLFVALTAAGAGHAPAAAAIIIYRLLSCWAILPIGFVCWLVQKRP